MRPHSPEHWHLVWNQLRERGGMHVGPLDLHTGDKVAVTGTGECNGLLKRFAPVTGVVDRAGWIGDHFEFTVRCEEWMELPPTFWSDPVILFDNAGAVESVTRY